MDVHLLTRKTQALLTIIIQKPKITRKPLVSEVIVPKAATLNTFKLIKWKLRNEKFKMTDSTLEFWIDM